MGLAGACASREPCVAPPDVPALTGVEGGAFLSAEGPFLPRGVNSYPLLDHTGWGRFDEVDEIFTQAVELGRPLVRTGAYMTAGTNPARLRDADGAIREEGLEALDDVVARAAEHGVQLLLVTANHWPNYGGAPAVLEAVAPGEELPVEAFYADPRAIDHQRAFLETLATRVNTVNGRAYADDPTIVWELANEARCTNGAYCDDDTLARWAQTMGRALRDAGATQPIAWGGQGFLGAWGEDLERIAQVDEVDILTVHLYPDHYGAQTFELGSGADRVPAAIRYGASFIHDAARVARESDKALLVEEAGWRSEAATRDDERAIVLGAWARVAADVSAGFLPWMIAERDRPDYDGYLIRPESEPRTAEVLRCD